MTSLGNKISYVLLISFQFAQTFSIFRVQNPYLTKNWSKFEWMTDWMTQSIIHSINQSISSVLLSLCIFTVTRNCIAFVLVRQHWVGNRSIYIWLDKAVIKRPQCTKYWLKNPDSYQKDQTNKQTDRQPDTRRHTYRQTQTDTQTDSILHSENTVVNTHTDRHTDTQADRHTHTDRQCHVRPRIESLHLNPWLHANMLIKAKRF